MFFAFVVDNRRSTPDFMQLGCVKYWYLFQKKPFDQLESYRKFSVSFGADFDHFWEITRIWGCPYQIMGHNSVDYGGNPKGFFWDAQNHLDKYNSSNVSGVND